MNLPRRKAETETERVLPSLLCFVEKSRLWKSHSNWARAHWGVEQAVLSWPRGKGTLQGRKSLWHARGIYFNHISIELS